MKLRTTAAIFLCAFTGAGCERDPYANLSSPREFLQKQQIGSSRDYAVIKFQNVEDHVATIHGFANDGEACEKVASALNTDACAETDGQSCLNPFSCHALN
jgi:hypothetical protein